MIKPSLILRDTVSCVQAKNIEKKKNLAHETKTHSNNIKTKWVAPQLILNNFHTLF